MYVCHVWRGGRYIVWSMRKSSLMNMLVVNRIAVVERELGQCFSAV